MGSDPRDPEEEDEGTEDWSIVFVTESQIEAEIAADAIDDAEIPVSIETFGRNSHEVQVPEEHEQRARELLRVLREGDGEASKRYQACVQAGTLVEEGHSLVQADLTDQAMERYRRALELDPKCSAAHLGAAKLLRKQNQTEAAHAAVVKVTEIDPSDRNGWISLASLCLDMHRPDDARAAYDKVIELYPDDIRAYRGRGIVYAQEYKLAQAMKAFEEALEIDPDDTLSLVQAATCQYRLGRLEQALEFAERALQSDPDHLGALMVCGRTEWRLKRYVDSEDTLTDALERHKDNAEVQAYLAATLIDQGGRMERAKKLLDRALAKHPTHGLLKMTMARLHAVEKDNPYRDSGAAERMAKEVVGANPKNPEFQNSLAEILLGQGKKEEARQAAEAAVKIAPEMPAYQETLARVK